MTPHVEVEESRNMGDVRSGKEKGQARATSTSSRFSDLHLLFSELSFEQYVLKLHNGHMP